MNEPVGMKSRFSRELRSIACLGVCFALMACTTHSVQSKRIARCVVGEICLIEGQLIATHGKGRIEDRTGCVSVGLPDYVNDDWNLRQVRASGRIYDVADLESSGLFAYEIDGRWFDAEGCNKGVAMRVDRIESTD